MRAGRMDRLVTLQTRTETQDSYGDPVITWTTLATVWAERLEMRGDERWTAQQVLDRIQCKYRIRYRDDVTTKDGLTDGSAEYDIQAVIPLGRREGLELVVATRET